ncbi:hypothetical protein V8F33_005429 [Rhypophila sp. PSN 637]
MQTGSCNWAHARLSIFTLVISFLTTVTVAKDLPGDFLPSRRLVGWRGGSGGASDGMDKVCPHQPSAHMIRPACFIQLLDGDNQESQQEQNKSIQSSTVNRAGSLVTFSGTFTFFTWTSKVRKRFVQSSHLQKLYQVSSFQRARRPRRHGLFPYIHLATLRYSCATWRRPSLSRKGLVMVLFSGCAAISKLLWPAGRNCQMTPIEEDMSHRMVKYSTPCFRPTASPLGLSVLLFQIVTLPDDPDEEQVLPLFLSWASPS